MYSFRRLALLLALALPAMPAVLAQSSSSSAPATDQNQQPAAQTPQQISVQARIRMRREQRRATAIHDAYDHLYEAFTDMGYLRFAPGPSRQRLTFYGWDTGATRFLSERFGVTVDARGYYGTAYVGLNQYNLTRPSISEYNVMAGPTYRFYLLPKYSVSGRVLGGVARNDFSGDTGGFGTKALGLYPDATTFAASAGVVGQYNVTPTVGLRLSGEYLLTGYGSTIQNSFGFTGGLVYRFGKQQ